MKEVKGKGRKFIGLIIILTMVLNIFPFGVFNVVQAAQTNVGWDGNQQIELKFSIKDYDDKGKQLEMEVWGNNLETRGFEVNLGFDSSVIVPSVGGVSPMVPIFNDPVENSGDFKGFSIQLNGTSVVDTWFRNISNYVEKIGLYTPAAGGDAKEGEVYVGMQCGPRNDLSELFTIKFKLKHSNRQCIIRN